MQSILFDESSTVEKCDIHAQVSFKPLLSAQHSSARRKDVDTSAARFFLFKVARKTARERMQQRAMLGCLLRTTDF